MHKPTNRSRAHKQNSHDTTNNHASNIKEQGPTKLIPFHQSRYAINAFLRGGELCSEKWHWRQTKGIRCVQGGSQQVSSAIILYHIILHYSKATYHLLFLIPSYSYQPTALKLYRSERQARLQKEQSEMMEKISKIRKTDFDNTRRIERPEEILERRKNEREKRNVWYRRAWRSVTFQK